MVTQPPLLYSLRWPYVTVIFPVREVTFHLHLSPSWPVGKVAPPPLVLAEPISREGVITDNSGCSYLLPFEKLRCLTVRGPPASGAAECLEAELTKLSLE